MEILRIPTHYRGQMEYMTDEDRGYILLSLMRLSEGEMIQIEQNMRGGVTISIWREACQLEKKARKGKGEEYHEVDPIISYSTPGGGPLRVTPEVDPEIHPNPTQPNPNQIKSTQPKSNQNSSKEEGEQALDVYKNQEVYIDHRAGGTQRIIDIIGSQVVIEGFIYDNNPEERRRATIIAKRQSDWGIFIKDTLEDREEEIIRSIIAYSNQNEYSAKIRSCKDFHEKWKKVANSMKQSVKNEKIETDRNFIPKF